MKAYDFQKEIVCFLYANLAGDAERHMPLPVKSKKEDKIWLVL